MTPTQYYFPYFLHLDHFNKELKLFDLSSHVNYDPKTQQADALSITNHSSKDTLLTIPFGATLMVQGHKLFYWKTDYDLIDITQVNLDKLKVQLNWKIDLQQFNLGHNKIDSHLDMKDLVTFVRKEDLKYDQEYYEKFVIVVINKADIDIIPFDWFNKTGGDYGYVWPATAKLDTKEMKLYGQGMRMSEFVVDLAKACL